MATPIHTVVLAGGEGRRMCSALAKPLHPLCGLPMMSYVLRAARLDESRTPIAVLGHCAGEIGAHYRMVRTVEQGAFAGSGGALCAALPLLKNETGRALVVAADLPLLRRETLLALAALPGDAAFLSSVLPDPAGHARVLRGSSGEVEAIAEGGLTPEQELIRETRVSAYCFELGELIPLLESLCPDAADREVPMAEIVRMLLKAGCAVRTLSIPPEEALGVNDRAQLACATKELRRRINLAHMRAGVTMIDPDCTYVDATVKLGRDVTLYPGVVLEGNTVIGEGTVLYPACRIADSQFGKNCSAQGVVAREAVVGDSVALGPYVNLRPQAQLRDGVHVGNYIEVKNSVVGEGTKLPHLSYIGDGDVGRHVNVGCGTVFVNYDGYKKHRTVIGDNAFIGCHTALVAPVRVGAGAFTAAGSVITEDVPPDSLAVARARQVNKEGYVARLRVKRGETTKE